MTDTHEQREFWEMYDLLRQVLLDEPSSSARVTPTALYDMLRQVLLDEPDDLSDAVDAMRARGVGAEAIRSAHALGGVVAVKALMRGGGS